MKFTRTNTVAKVNGLEIVRYTKTGTKRVFFRPEFNGKPVNSTMFARQYDAETLAKAVKVN